MPKNLDINQEIYQSVITELKNMGKSESELVNEVNKLMAKNTKSILDATLEIKLNDSETFARVRGLVLRQRCYEMIRNNLISNPGLLDVNYKR